MRSEPRVDSNRRIGFVPFIASTRLVLRPATWVLVAGAIACGASRHGPRPADDPSFYDYTTDRVETLAEFRQLAASDVLTLHAPLHQLLKRPASGSGQFSFRRRAETRSREAGDVLEQKRCIQSR